MKPRMGNIIAGVAKFGPVPLVGPATSAPEMQALVAKFMQMFVDRVCLAHFDCSVFIIIHVCVLFIIIHVCVLFIIIHVCVLFIDIHVCVLFSGQ